MTITKQKLTVALLTGIMLITSATPALAMRNQTGTHHSANITIHESSHPQNSPSQHSGHSFALHQPEIATHQAIRSGDWTDPSVWNNGTLPADTSTVAIPQGVEVTVDEKIAERLKHIAIDGTLRFATDRNTELWVDTLTSSTHGRLEIGTADTPVAAGVSTRIVFADLGAIDLNEDPQQLGRGAVLAGPVVMYGAAKTHRITTAIFPTAGSQTLTLSEPPTGWRIGDKLVITGSQGATSDELRTITAIEGSQITLNHPLELDHVPPKADLNLWIANTTRNISFDSENDEVLRRGHIMFRHNPHVDINHVGFYNLGRTDKKEELNDYYFDLEEERPGNSNPAPINVIVEKGPATNIRGRYPVHFHRSGASVNDPAGIINGSVVVNSPGWGFVNHSSHAHFRNNVTYAVDGAAFYTEAGDEVGSMVGNIAIRTVNPTFRLDDEGAIDPDLGLDLGDFGNDGDGFWLSGNRVSLIDNVAAGSSAHGIIFWTDGLIEPDTGRSEVKVSDIENGHLIPNRETIPVWWAPVAEVRNNESYGATVGFRSRYIHSVAYLGEEVDSAWHQAPPKAYVDTLTPLFDGITVWGSRDGLLLNYNERISVRNARLIGIGDPFEHNLGHTAAIGVGFDLNNDATRGPGTIENVSIEGYEMGFIAPRHNYWRIDNMHLSNVTDMLIHEAIREPRIMPMSNITYGSLDGTAVAGREESRQHIVLAPEFTYAEFDPHSILWPDTITLDGRELFYNQQDPQYIPYGDEFEFDGFEDEMFEGDQLDDEEFEDDPFIEFPVLDTGYLNKTNQELMATYGQALAGEVLPADAINDPTIVNGKIAATQSAVLSQNEAETLIANLSTIPSTNHTEFSAASSTVQTSDTVIDYDEHVNEDENEHENEETETTSINDGLTAQDNSNDTMPLFMGSLAALCLGGLIWHRRRAR